MQRMNCSLAALALSGALACSAVEASTPEELVHLNCAGCHMPVEKPEAGLTRMQQQRKTPEGWQMTLTRMKVLHKSPFSDPDGASPEDVMRTLVKYFADTQGLAPAESARYRYSLEQRHNTIDTPEDPEYAVMCARCHAESRVGLQRRSEAEWRDLVHFHLAQFPTSEYSAGGRDRDWLGTGLDTIVPLLTKTYPYETVQWSDWQKATKPALAGSWRIAGHMPGKGDFEALMTATVNGEDHFSIDLKGQFSDGEALDGRGDAIVYTGYEWRASIEANGIAYKQVLAATENGAQLEGRMFQREREELGIDIEAWKINGKPQLLALAPAHLRQGGTQTLTLVGAGLSGKPDFGKGIRVDEISGSDAQRMVVTVSADSDAATGPRAIRIGNTTLDDALTVYTQIDRVEVTPAYAVGRVGGQEGSQDKVRATFEAIAMANGADGEPGTADDLRIGVVPAEWVVAPWDEKAAADNDVKFAGTMDKDSGVFTPAGAGPNPARKYHTNNAGNLKVLASVKDGERTLQGEGRLLVTVQRWNNPPIR